MQKHFDAPSSPAWHARRATCFNAGDAPAMLACSALKTRSQLLHELHTGLQKEFSDFVQERVIDPGHTIEALCRPLAEDILGEELQVLAGTLAVEGLSRPLGASLDGITFMEDVTWECKRLNEELRAAMPHAGRDSHQHNDGKALPKDKRVQMEQQMLVSGAKRALFTAGELNEQGEIADERHAWYYPDAALRAEILAAWPQFDADLAAYVPAAPASVEKIVAEPVEALPAPVIQVTGQLALKDNFKVFEEKLRHFLEHRLIREPQSDQDFADLDQQIKAMKQARESLKAAGAQMLAQVQPVEQATKKQEMLDKLLQQNLSMAERLLKDEKERRRGEIVAGGISALKTHVDALNTRLGRPYMPAVPVDFGGVVKGLKSLASMEDKVASELARAKIDANQTADRIQINLATLREKAADYVFLFPDTPQIVLKAADDLATLVAARIAEHKEKEQKRLDAERERIRAEESAKLQREQREAQEAEDALVASFDSNARRIESDSVPYIEKAMRAYESTGTDWANDPRPRVAAAFLAGRAYLKERLDAATAREADAKRLAESTPPAAAPTTVTAAPAVAVAPAPTVIPMPARAAVPTGKPTLSLGQIKERIAPLQLTAEGLATLGFTGLKERGSVLYQEAEFPHVLAAIVAHVQAIQAKQAA